MIYEDYIKLINKEIIMQDDKPKGRTIFILEEDILNLKCAEKRLLETLTPDYDALEIFSIRNIIKEYEEATA